MAALIQRFVGFFYTQTRQGKARQGIESIVVLFLALIMLISAL
jgi:hypothetical protein